MYKVIEDFIDLKDNNHLYHAGEPYPRVGAVVTSERLAELMGSANRRGRAVVMAVDAEKPKNKPVEKPEEKPARKTTKRTKKSAD